MESAQLEKALRECLDALDCASEHLGHSSQRELFFTGQYVKKVSQRIHHQLEWEEDAGRSV
jgi:hypothetical protein